MPAWRASAFRRPRRTKRVATLEAHLSTASPVRTKRNGVTALGQTPQQHLIEVIARLERRTPAMDDFRCITHGQLRL